MSKPKTAKKIAREIEQSFKQRKQQIEESMVGLDKGSRAYLDRLIAISKLEREYRDERAKRGLDPQNLGAVSAVEFVFRATNEPSNPNEFSAARQIQNEQWDREYGYGNDEDDDLPATPEPKKSKKGK